MNPTYSKEYTMPHDTLRNTVVQDRLPPANVAKERILQAQREIKLKLMESKLREQELLNELLEIKVNKEKSKHAK